MLEQLLKLLAQERYKIATQAMEAPAQDQFNHGVQVGHYKGLKNAEDLILQILNEAAEKEESFERFA